MRDILKEKGVDFFFNTSFEDCNIEYKYLINSAGAYADKIAQKFGLAKNYTMLPFKGIYLKYMTNKTDIKTNIYPVPNLANPFLGVHYTITNDGSIKIGPTAIPAFWRENYKGFSNFNFKEMIEIIIAVLLAIGGAVVERETNGAVTISIGYADRNISECKENKL